MKATRIGAVLVAVLMSLPTGADAQEDEGLDGDIALLGQSAFVGDETAFQLRLRVSVDDEARDQLFVRAATHGRSRTRSAFAATLADRPRTGTIDVAEMPLRDVPADEAGALLFAVPIVDATAPGVYPVRVELRGPGGVPIDGFTTHLIRTPATPDPEPLRVAVVVPIHAPPALLPDGSNSLAEQSASSLADVAVSLTRHSSPVNVLATPETIEALDANVVDTIGSALPGRVLLGRSFVATDPSALLAEDLQPVLASALSRGNAALAASLDVTPAVDTWVADTPLSSVAAEELHALGARRFVVPEKRLSELRVRTTLAAPFELDLGSDEAPVAFAIDEGISAHFDAADDEPVLAAHQLLADIAMVAGESSGVVRGIVVAPDAPWAADPAFVEAVLTGIDAATAMFRPVRIDTLFDEVDPLRARRATVQRRLLEPDTAMSIDATAVRDTRNRIAAFANLIGPDNLLPAELEAAALTSVALGNTVRVHRAYLAGVNDRIRGQLALIQAPERRSITLTARRGEIPITLRNGAPYPVRVRVRLQSETLDLPEGEVREVELAPGAHTERFTVEARSSGAFRLRVLIESPEGALQVASTQFTVRVTATSGVGLALSIGAGGFLLVWWASHLRGRRSRRLVPA